MNTASPKNELPIEPLYKHRNNKQLNIIIDNNNKSKKKNTKFIPPTLDLIQQYFIEKNKPGIEAEKFFNYFESNGWKIGGRSPMKNWKAAANNWMINSNKFNAPTNHPKPDNLNTNQDKDYDIPL